MKASFLSENLQEKIVLVNHAVSNKSQLPILLNILIKTGKGNLSISATDLEIGIEINIPAKIEEEGEITIPAKTFSELMGTIAAGKVSLSTEGDSLLLIGGRTNARFQTIKAEEFPRLYDSKGKKILAINKDIIQKGLPVVVFAASQDTSRPALSGVLIKEERGEEGDRIILVATDGYRLSLKKSAFGKKEESKEKINILIPARMIRELISLTKNENDVDAYVAGGNNQIVFIQNDTKLVGRLLETEYPNYEKIIPTDFSTRTEFDKDDLHRAIKACYIFARSSANIVKLSIGKEKIVAYVNAPSVGENTVEVEAKTTGEENEIAFNARYLLDLFSNIEDESMVFEMTGPLNPGVFKIAGDDTFLHLIMPIRVQQEA